MHGSGFSPTIQEAGSRRAGTHALRFFGAAIFLLVCLFPEFLTPPCAAQIRISGRVLTVDSTPVYRAIVRLRDATDSTVTARVLTGEQGEFSFILSATDELPHGVPFGMSLSAFPNPSNGITRLRFRRPDRAITRLVVVDMLGRGIATLTDETLEAGEYETAWDGRVQGAGNSAAGMYLAVLSDNRTTVTRTILLAASRHAPVSPAALRRIGTLAPLRKTTGAINILLDVADTTAALPRFVSREAIEIQFSTDTSVTVTVVYGGREDLDFPIPSVNRLRLDDPWLYVCSGAKGLWRRNIQTMAAWAYIGLANDTSMTPDSKGIVDVDAAKDTILAAANYYRRIGPRDSVVSVWKSANGGNSWYRSDRGIIETLGSNGDRNYLDNIRHSPHDDNVYFATAGAAVYRSYDQGKNWTHIYGPREVFAWIQELWWHPLIPGEVWLCQHGSFETKSTYKYSNYGEMGMPVFRIDLWMMSMAFSPVDNATRYYTTGWLARSKDGGSTWNWLREFDLPKSESYVSVKEHPSRDDILFAGSDRSAVYLLRPHELSYSLISRFQGTFYVIPLIDRQVEYMYLTDGTHVLRVSIKDY